MGTEVRRVSWRWIVGLSPLALVLIASAGFGVTYSSTPSVPIGLYRIERLDGEPRRGDIVGVCLEGGVARWALERGYVSPRGLERLVYGTRCGVGVIGKPVAGVPGDTIDVGADGVRVNGSLLAGGPAARLDRRGRPVPRTSDGRIVLAAGEFWLQSPRSVALDSRIFGQVQRAAIRDRRVPVSTTRHPRKPSR